MNKLVLALTLGLSALLWISCTMANPHGNRGMNKPMIQKGKVERQEGKQNIYYADEMRDLGQQQIKEGKELIKAGYKEEGKAMIQQGTDTIHRANNLHREGVHDVHTGNQDIYEGRKNIRDRDHN